MGIQRVVRCHVSDNDVTRRYRRFRMIPERIGALWVLVVGGPTDGKCCGASCTLFQLMAVRHPNLPCVYSPHKQLFRGILGVGPTTYIVSPLINGTRNFLPRGARPKHVVVFYLNYFQNFHVGIGSIFVIFGFFKSRIEKFQRW